jgi:uridine phosphorylase
MPIRIEPLIDPSPEAILVGDPRRAFALAQAFTEEPKMTHLARGLWGYGGQTPDGRGLTVQSTGAGGPAAAAVLSDLAVAGVETAVRMGTCESVEGGPRPGQVVLVTGAFALDGAGRALIGERDAGADVRVEPDSEITERLRVELGDLVLPAEVSSHDLVARLDRDAAEDAKAQARDLQTAAFFATSARTGVRAAALLVVVEDSSGTRLAESEIEDGLIALWPGVARALGKA